MARSLPSRPSLESDRKRAKALKKAHAARDAEALARIREHHPRFRSVPDAEIGTTPLRLADAQLVVAREAGVESWPRLVALIGFLRADFDERVRLFLEAAVGEWPRRAHDLLARSPEIARANLQTSCAAGDEAAAIQWLERDPSSATRRDGPLGAPPLWTLCWSGLNPSPVEAARVQIAKRLLEAGADPNATAERDTRFGRHAFGALYGTIDHDQPDLAKVLLEAGADPNDGESLYHATERADARCLSLLLQHGGQPAQTNALKRALDKPNPEPVRRLLEAGDDPNAAGPGPSGHGTALHHAAYRGRERGILELLVAHGADLDREDESGFTPCVVARRHGHTRTADDLLALGADGAIRPLDLFVGHCAAGDRERAVALLAEHPDLMERLDPRDHAALPIAAEYGRVRAIGLMLDLGWPIEATGGDFSATALNHAAHMGHVEAVRVLLERGADPEIDNEFEGNAIGALCWASTSDDAGQTYAPGLSMEERQAHWVACVDALVAAGARIRGRSLSNASEPVAEALRRHGAAESDE